MAGIRFSLGITIFEAQILRNFVARDTSALLVELEKQFDLIIFTSKQLADRVSIMLKEVQLSNVPVVTFEGRQESLITRLFSSPLRWSIKSGAILVKSKRNGYFSSIKRLTLRFFLSRSRLIKQILRKGTALTYTQRAIRRRFVSSYPPKVDFIFSTSLTNYIEDFAVILFYRRLGAKVIATSRSWDNFTSHGSIYLEPDLLLSHSDWQKFALEKYQGFPGDKIFNWGNPPYLLSRFTSPGIDRWISNLGTYKKVTYASMGTATNPDDKNFVNWLIEEWKQLPSDLILTILLHPKFVIEVNGAPDNVKLMKFDYEISTVSDYFSFLADQDLVICGGTSVVLDCAFIRTPVALVGFEIENQKYWHSALRYFDYFDHTRCLFGRSNYFIIKDKEDLLLCIEQMLGVIPDWREAKYFFGSVDKPLSEVIQDTVRAIQRTSSAK